MLPLHGYHSLAGVHYWPADLSWQVTTEPVLALVVVVVVYDTHYRQTVHIIRQVHIVRAREGFQFKVLGIKGRDHELESTLTIHFGATVIWLFSEDKSCS